MKNPWKKNSSKVVLKNKWFSVRKDKVVKPNGEPGEYNVIMTNHASYIIPITESGKVCMIELYRYPTNQISLELPAGSTDGQKPIVAAKRELLEETGYKCKKITKIGEFQAFNGISDEITHVFVAEQLTKTKTNSQVEEGITKVLELSFDEIDELIRTKKITDGQSIASLYYTKLYLDKFHLT